MMNKKEKLETTSDCLIFISLASMYLDNGMVDEAIDLCKSGLDIEPENEEAHLIMAKAELEKGNKEDARQRLLKILNKNPKNKTAKELLDEIGVETPSKSGDEKLSTKEATTTEEEEEGKKEIKEPVVEDKNTLPMKQEEVLPQKETPVEVEVDENERKFFTEKIAVITKLEGIINCFFRTKNGAIIKDPQLVGNIDELMPLLTSLLDSASNASKELKMGELELMLVEIEKGVFYIFKTNDFDCFILSRNADNFGLLKAVLPKILKISTQ